MKLSEKLVSLRRASGMTQDELAAKLFVTRTAVSKWENDKGYPGIDSLKLLSQVYNISLDELISDDDVVAAQKAKKEAFAHILLVRRRLPRARRRLYARGAFFAYPVVYNSGRRVRSRLRRVRVCHKTRAQRNVARRLCPLYRQPRGSAFNSGGRAHIDSHPDLLIAQNFKNNL